MTNFRYLNQGDHYDIVAPTGLTIETVPDITAARRQVSELNHILWQHAEAHHCDTHSSRTGGSMIAGGGNFRESECYCSCGWCEEENGQTYAESVQFIREHLKSMDVYTTPLEQAVYAMTPDNDTGLYSERIADAAGKTVGRTRTALRKLEQRGNVEFTPAGRYRRTDKWFSWND